MSPKQKQAMRGAEHLVKKLEADDAKKTARMEKDGTSEWRDPEDIESKLRLVRVGYR